MFLMSSLYYLSIRGARYFVSGAAGVTALRKVVVDDDDDDF